MSNPPTLMNRVNATVASGRTSAGITELQDLINSGLTVREGRSVLHPRLAESVPTVENGLWRVIPDGRTETTWRIRPGAEWHDGVPFTAEDIVFTAQLVQDRELPFPIEIGYELIEIIETTAPGAITVRWKRPYIDADAMFAGAELVPRHLLEAPYAEDKASLANHPYWSTGFVGAGPFKLREFVRSSHLVLVANDRYVLGRPKVDEIEVKFLPDPNALAANILAGAVELTLGQNLSLETALQVSDQWKEGKLETASAGGNPLHMFPQLLNPRPPVLADVRFRRALLHAIDRQELIDSIMAGRASIAHGIIWDAGDREYADIQARIVRYEFNPTRAAQIIEGLGYTRGPDGFFRTDAQGRPETGGSDPGGQRLSVEIRTLSQTDSSMRVLFPVADYWQRIGVAAETLVVPEQRTADREYRATRPGFDVTRLPRDLSRLHSREVPLPENSFRGTNRSRYMNPEFDALIDAYFMTIPWRERMDHLGRIVEHLTDQVIAMGLFFDVTPAMIGSRLINVKGGGQGVEVWNAHEWDVTPPPVRLFDMGRLHVYTGQQAAR